jgi:hypothetical protein
MSLTDNQKVENDEQGHIVSGSRTEIDLKKAGALIPQTYRPCCARCSMEYSRFPKLQCWYDSSLESVECIDCTAKGKACKGVSTLASL